MAILDPGYHPGAGTSVNFAVSDTSAQSAALAEGTWYQVWCTVDCHWCYKTATAATTHPALPSYTLSEPFQAKDSTSKVAALRIGATSGTMYVNVHKPDARA